MRNLNKFYSESKRPRSWPQKAALLLAICLVIAAGAQAVLAQANPDQTFRQFLPVVSNSAQPASDHLTLVQQTDTRVVAAAASETGATIASDLADYPPGATVTLTGAGWQANEAVHIFVNDDSSNTWTYDSNPDPVADANGDFTYAFQLPNWFVANYSVIATGGPSGTATTTFTDAAGSFSKPYAHWSDEPLPGDWNNNILNANKSNYFEGEVIPHVFMYGASNNAQLVNGQTYSFNVTYNWYQQNTDAGGFAYMTQYNLSRQPTVFDWASPAIAPTADSAFTNGNGMAAGASFYTVDADVTNVSAVTYTGTGTKDGNVTITFKYTGATTSNGYAAIYYGLYVAKPGEVPDQGAGKTNGANAWSGGSLQTTVDIGGSGATSLQLAPSAIIAGEISGQKFNDLNSNGTKDTGEPGLAGWTICLDSDSDPNNGNLGCVVTANGTTTDLDGNGVIDPVGFYYFSVTPGTYYVYEVNQSGWTQTAPATGYYGPLVVNATTSTYLNQNFGNAFNTGSLKILKTLSNPDGASVPTSFTINYNCGGTYAGTVSVAAGGSQTISNIPTGSVCTVSEPALTAIAGYTWGTPVVTGSPATIGKNTTVEVTVANSITKDTGSLKISKSVSNPDGATLPTSFTINYDCGGTYAGSVSVAAGDSATVSGIPTGSSCTVSEPALTPIAGYTWATPVVTGSPATIGKNTTVEVAVANSLTRDRGSFKITKTTSNPDGATLPAAFTGTYNCGTGYAGTWSVAYNGSQTISGIPTGNTCSVTEDALTPIAGYTWGTPTYTPATIKIDTKGGTFEIVVHNSITHDRGILTIAKTVNNPDGATLPASFTINYDCGQDTDGTTALTGSRSVAAGGNATVSGIPTGNTCTVSEAALSPISGYTWGTPTITPASVVIADTSSTFALTVANSITRDRGSLKISKTVSNPDGASVPASFSVNYSCDDGTTGNVTVALDSPATVSDIPTGSSCSVTEVAPAAIPGYTWGTITYSPASVTISTKGGTFEIVVGNSITRDTGSFKITKHTNNPDGATLPAAFTGTYDCGTGYTGNWSVANNGSQTISGIPTDSTCSVIETAPATIPGYTWGSIAYNPTTIKIDTKGGTFEIVVDNSITRDRGSLSISKTLSNPDNAPVPASFSVNYNCGTGYTGNVSVAPGSPATINNIPTGNTCTVTEVAPTPITDYTWGAISYTPTSVVISTKGGIFSITVGNSITRDRGTIIIKKISKPANTGSFAFTTTGTGYSDFTLPGGGENSQTLPTGVYTVKEGTQLGWILTGIGGSTDPNTPYNCTVSGSSSSTGVGDLGTQTATITLKKGDTVTCVFENTGNGATRTQGFWATHPQLAQIAWFKGTAYGHTFPGVAGVLGDTTLCGRPIDTLGKLMGGFWSSVSMTSTGGKRSALDQARMQLLQQLLAAELNASAFGSAPSGGAATINAWEAAYCGTNQTAIKNAQAAAASFNSNGDSATFTPGTSADSKSARAGANYLFWDILP